MFMIHAAQNKHIIVLAINLPVAVFLITLTDLIQGERRCLPHTHLVLSQLDVPPTGGSLLLDLHLVIPPGPLQFSDLLPTLCQLLFFKGQQLLTLLQGITDLLGLLHVMGGVYLGFDVLEPRLGQDMLLGAG